MLRSKWSTPKRVDYLQTQLHRLSRSRGRFSARRSGHEGLRTGCVHCDRRFYGPGQFFARDEPLTEKLRDTAAPQLKHAVQKFGVKSEAKRLLLDGQDDEKGYADDHHTGHALPRNFPDIDRGHLIVYAGPRKPWPGLEVPSGRTARKTELRSFVKDAKVKLLRFSVWTADCNLCGECATELDRFKGMLERDLGLPSLLKPLRAETLESEDAAVILVRNPGTPKATVDVTRGEIFSGRTPTRKLTDRRELTKTLAREAEAVLSRKMPPMSFEMRADLEQLKVAQLQAAAGDGLDAAVWHELMLHKKTRHSIEPEHGPSVDERARHPQYRSVQQSKFFATFVLHRRALKDDEPYQHVMSRIAKCCKLLFSSLHLSGMFKFGLTLRGGGVFGTDPRWEPWTPNKPGGETTGVGHYADWHPTLAQNEAAAKNRCKDPRPDHWRPDHLYQQKRGFTLEDLDATHP